MYESIKNNAKNKFYEIKKSVIFEAQQDMGVIIPDELKSFYVEIGYGFLQTKSYNFNRIMDPGSVCDFRLRQGVYADDSELEIYDEHERDKLVFFEICEGYYLSMGFSKNNYGKIFDGEEEIAENLEQFLIKYQEDERYFNK